MANTIAILLFDGAEEMDFVGPWEVFTAAVDRLTGVDFPLRTTSEGIIR